MDPENVTKSKMQIGFIRFVLLPLFEAISKVTCLLLNDPTSNKLANKVNEKQKKKFNNTIKFK